ncbi:hypothetical protein G3A44_00975 [Ideonella sp. TBM-1]|uniref:Uncharacterized protein n=1 Tax=Ideonella livida TaxID=2707176 RepID=A0A7C9TGJ8_9BURK|nr:hypothetical protein [Ideonella livida]
MSAQDIADWLGKPRDTLYKEVDPRNRMAKAGAVDVVTATQYTANWVFLNAFAAEVGAVVVPMPGGAAAGTGHAHIAELAKQFAELVAKVSSSLADDDITENELHDCQREAGELIAAVQAALAFIQAMRARKADSLERRAYALRELS